MSASKHTPGPWKIAKDTYGVTRIWDKDLDCDVACCEGDGSIPREVQEANALLIAAAPDMHKVLSTVLPIFTALAKQNYTQLGNGFEAEIKAWQTALAKAEGAE